MVGGTIEAGEDAKVCLIRESYEEAGVIIKAKELKLVHVLQKVSKNEQRIVLYFKAYRWEGELKARERHKFKKAEWFSLEELPVNITPSVKQVLVQYRHGNPFSSIWK
jgi:ADP-ribose pyrophosphatase YjhB (NUDIX family)